LPSKRALLIDAENVSYNFLPRILKETSLYGQLIWQVAYGDSDNPNVQRWGTVAKANNIEIRPQSNTAKIKNFSDIKLIIEAMDVLYKLPVDAFCLVSNDAHYVPLCDKIRENRKEIIGIGYPHAAEALIRACDRFIFIGRGETYAQPFVTTQLDVSPSPSVPTVPRKIAIAPKPALPVSPVAPPQPAASPKPANQAALRKLLTQSFAQAPQDANHWVEMTALGQALSKVQPGFRTNTYGHSNLTKLLKSMPETLYRLKGTALRQLRGSKNKLAYASLTFPLTSRSPLQRACALCVAEVF
jgi:hypothetical protein